MRARTVNEHHMQGYDEDEKELMKSRLIDDIRLAIEEASENGLCAESIKEIVNQVIEEVCGIEDDSDTYSGSMRDDRLPSPRGDMDDDSWGNEPDWRGNEMGR